MAPTLIPAGHGVATPLPQSSIIKVINTHGTQVVDLWAFSTSLSSSTATPPDYQDLSMQSTHVSLKKLVPQVGDTMVSNERKPMLTVVEDTTEGRHDTLVAACDKWRFEQLGVEGEHRNCADNLVEGLKSLGIPAPPFTPAPLNLFMNVPIQKDGSTISIEACRCEPGQYVSMKAEMDLVVVMSACPQDVNQPNKATDAHYEVIRSSKTE